MHNVFPYSARTTWHAAQKDAPLSDRVQEREPPCCRPIPCAGHQTATQAGKLDFPGKCRIWFTDIADERGVGIGVD